MTHTQELTCPHCNETFAKSRAAYAVCLTCGRIWPPGESWTGHGPPIADPDPDDPDAPDIFAECNTALTVYTEADALEKQDDVRTDPHKFSDVDVTPPWEREDFEEAWTPDEDDEMGVLGYGEAHVDSGGDGE